MDGWLVALISGLTGVVSGGLGSLAAPWAQWGVEKRKSAHTRRTNKIKVWRSEIDALAVAVEKYRNATDVSTYISDYEYYDVARNELVRALDLTTQQWFHSLLEQLDEAEATELEEELRDYAQSHNGEPAIALLSRAVERIDRNWGLS